MRFKIDDDIRTLDDLSLTKLAEFIGKHEAAVASRYRELGDAYEGKYEILNKRSAGDWKPCNKISVNFAKYITNIFEGYFVGNPIKVTSDDEAVSSYIEMLDAYNNQDDQNAELSKSCSKYGSAFEMYYVTEDKNIGIHVDDAVDGFMLVRDSVLEEPVFYVRYHTDVKKVKRGSISDSRAVRYFKYDPDIQWEGEEFAHGFDGVPAVEYVQNEERLGLYEDAMSMINAYNKALSEKADDVDWFADAYMKILGARLTQEELRDLRQRRIINFSGNEDGKLVVEFMEKPNADATQENLINHLHQLIFQIAMVADISDENFGTASGIALRYKLFAMQSLAKTKERKFSAAMTRRYRIIFSNALSGMRSDAWMSAKFKFTPNTPANLLEEAQTAAQMSGITSRKTQLSVLSAVDDVAAELEEIEKEEDVTAYDTDFAVERNGLLGTAEETTV